MNGETPESHSEAYELTRTDGSSVLQKAPTVDSLDQDSAVGSEPYSYQDGAGSSVTGHAAAHVGNIDATDVVHEMHLALLYLLSNPEEFKKAVNTHPPRGATTLSEWNAEYEDDDESVMTSGTATTPLPFIVFADDAEVVLPQAYSASQLFGIERVEGIELEAAAGIPALSQLFLRWLALMPGGDHLNIINPPGLTVMRIAGGRYRVTAAHRVVWTWMNEFAVFAEDGGIVDDEHPGKPSSPKLQVGDLVSLTIVDVFETDSQGRLLSYCPTFDNRAVVKTNQASETIRKSSTKFFSMLGSVRRAVANSEANKKASAQLSKMKLMSKAKNVAENVRHKVDEAVHNYSSPNRQSSGGDNPVTGVKEFEEAISAAEAAATAESKPNEQEKEKEKGKENVSNPDVTVEELESDTGVNEDGQAEI